jgi:hypothetical protein
MASFNFKVPRMTFTGAFVTLAALVLVLPLRPPAMRIPYYHSWSGHETLYWQIYWDGKIPSQIVKVQVNPSYPGGAFFGKAYVFPGGWRVETTDFGPKDSVGFISKVP